MRFARRVLAKYFYLFFSIRLLNSPPATLTGSAVRINRILSIIKGTKYLEIGVNQGFTFEGVSAKTKVGVDPVKKVITSKNEVFFKMYSDDYFKINHDKYDLIFIDGLHEYRQVLKDIINALNKLTHTGVVLVDDVIPSNNIEASKKISLLTESEKKDVSKGNFSWQGDVYKAIFLLTNLYADTLNFATLIDDRHFQMIIWKKNFNTEIKFPSTLSLSKFDDENLLSNLNNQIPTDWREIKLENLHVIFS
jgi:hypothetical protein